MERFTSDDYGEGYWERAEGSNYRNYGDDPGWRGILHVMAMTRPPGLNIIEAACSKGYFVRHARRWGHNAVGFDLSEYAISKSVAPEVTQVHDATTPWPYEDGVADIVAAWEFFEHIPTDQVDDVMVEMDRVLKPGGELWLKTGIVVPDDHEFAGQEDHDHTHVTVWTREQWEDFFYGVWGYESQRDIEAALDEEFKKRDWKGRFFVYRKPL